MAIKKAFVEVMSYLNSNLDKKVEDVIEKVEEFASAKVGGGGKATQHHRNEQGEVVAVFDYYFKKWVSPFILPFGKKSSSSSGLSGMSKLGTSHWNRQLKEFKEGKDGLLTAVIADELAPEDVQGKIEELSNQRDEIAEMVVEDENFADYKGFDTLEDCLEHAKHHDLPH